MKISVAFTSTIRWSLFILIFSCEIEDDFGKPDMSEYFGTKLYTSNEYLTKILWSEMTNEIVAVSDFSVFAINLDTKTKREIAVNPRYGYGSELIWLAGNMLYYLNNESGISGVNIANPNAEVSLFTDSVASAGNTSPYTSSYFAYTKWLYDANYEPYIFLYHFNTKKETKIGSGIPITFSPDEQKLLFLKAYTLHYYDLQTKNTISLQIPANFDQIIRWTSAGILFYNQNSDYRSIDLFNATINQQIGSWQSTVPFYLQRISASGNKIITQKDKCAVKDIIGNCPTLKLYYSIVDLADKTETETIYSNQPNVMSLMFSPSENSIAFIKDGNSIYLAEKKD